MEIWKPVVGYEGLYEVSNLGRVKSVARYVKKRNGSLQPVKEHIMTPCPTKFGYMRLLLCKDLNHSNESVHRLVAKAFIPNPHHYPDVNHIDENKGNNKVNNLEWCSVSYNNKYGSRLKRVSKHVSQALSGHSNPEQWKSVLQISLDGKVIHRWPSVTEAAKHGFSQSRISACCHHYKYAHSHRGYKWEFERLK